LVAKRPREREEDEMSTMERSTVDIDADMRLLCDEELDVVIGGVSGGGCFHLPQVLSVLTSATGGANALSTGISTGI
jgi:hypothetical protein